MIELIIAMAIGLVIVAGVSALYLSSSGVSRQANQIATTEQSAQLAMMIIGNSLKLAAYGEVVGTGFVARGQTLMDGTLIRGCKGSRFVDPFPVGVVVLPDPPIPPDLNCGGAAPGDAIYVRYQARPVIAEMLAASAARAEMLDCVGQNVPAEATDPSAAGGGLVRLMVTNVFQYDSVNQTLDCRGSGGAAFNTLVANVEEFEVYYRFDDVGFAIGQSNNETNAAPTGGSFRDATAINALGGGAVDPWEHVVAVVVCMTIATNEAGVSVSSVNNAVSRCPVSAAEAEVGINLVRPVPTTDGRVRRTYSQTFTIRAKATAVPNIAT